MARKVGTHEITAGVISAMVERIVEQLHPLQVILFGSRARGDARPRSDVDLFVVIRDGQDRRRAWDDASDALRDFQVPNDVIVATPGEIARFGNLVGMVIRPALRHGRVLYDAARGFSVWSAGDEDGYPPPLEGGIVTDSERLAETHRLVDRASKDLGIAELHAQGEYAEPSTACYHAQQAAKKALKAVLVFLQFEFERTYNLDELRNLLPAGWKVKKEHPDLSWLAAWAVKGRYPGPWPDPTEADAQGATRQARAVLESVDRDLRQHGFEAGPRS